MEITRISGGIEYRPEIMTLVLPGDRDYRVRSIRANGNVIMQSSSKLANGILDYVPMELSAQSSTLSNQKGLAFLRQLGDMEAQGIGNNYPGMDMKDEYAGGHRGIIDIRV
jgi:hypothetical protein